MPREGYMVWTPEPDWNRQVKVTLKCPVDTATDLAGNEYRVATARPVMQVECTYYVDVGGLSYIEAIQAARAIALPLWPWQLPIRAIYGQVIELEYVPNWQLESVLLLPAGRMADVINACDPYLVLDSAPPSDTTALVPILYGQPTVEARMLARGLYEVRLQVTQGISFERTRFIVVAWEDCDQCPHPIDPPGINWAGPWFAWWRNYRIDWCDWNCTREDIAGHGFQWSGTWYTIGPPFYPHAQEGFDYPSGPWSGGSGGPGWLGAWYVYWYG